MKLYKKTKQNTDVGKAAPYTLIPGLVAQEMSESPPWVGLFPSFYMRKLAPSQWGVVPASPATPRLPHTDGVVHAPGPFVTDVVEDQTFPILIMQSFVSSDSPLRPLTQILPWSPRGMHT